MVQVSKRFVLQTPSSEAKGRTLMFALYKINGLCPPNDSGSPLHRVI